MKQTLLLLSISRRWLLVGLLLLARLVPAFASHIQGGQISYRYVGPGAALGTDRYEVTISFYRDCTGIDLPGGSIMLQARRSGCNIVGQFAALSPVGAPQVGQPYCPRVQALVTCSTSSPRPLYTFRDYRGTIDLVPAPEWVLSYDDAARPSTANLVGQGSFRFEARLSTLVTLPGTTAQVVVHNTSPQFSPQDKPVPYVSVNQPASVLFAGTEPDGDSLVYALDSPLETCGVYNSYRTRLGTCVAPPPVAGCPFTCPTTNGPGQPYTSQLPIDVVYDVTGTCPGPRTLTPRLKLNPETGLLQFTPRILATTAPIIGDNKYVVVCKISEYRRLPGSKKRVLVGSVRRDYLITVVDGAGNSLPNTPTASLDPAQLGGSVVNTPQTTQIAVASCNYTTARVVFTDPDNAAAPGFPNGANQLLTVTYTGSTPLKDLLQNGEIGTSTLTLNGTARPVLVFAFQPNPAYIGRVLRLPFRVEDDACPLKGVQERIIEITITDGRRVVVQAQATSQGLGATLPPTICPGAAVSLTGAITRVDSVRQLVNNVVTTVAQNYELRWTAINNNGLPAVTSTRQTGPFPITVRPTVTTRYVLQANPLGTSSFPNTFPVDNNGLSVCGDTTSVLVRVVPEPQLAISAPDTVICAGRTVVLTGRASRPDGIADTYTYRWDGPGVAGNTTTSVTVTPQATTRYTFTATGDPRFGCDKTTSLRIRVVPLATAAFQLDSVASTSSATRFLPPITYTLTNQSRLSGNVAPFAADTVRYTYQRVRDERGRPVSEPEKTIAKGAAALGVNTLQLNEPGYYLIRLRVSTVASGQQCSPSTAQRTVFVPFFQIPNIITPNGDGKNDTFVLLGNKLGGKMEIYNRWGRKIEEYASYQNQWNGGAQPAGVYYYYFFTEPNGTKTKGWIEVIRAD